MALPPDRKEALKVLDDLLEDLEQLNLGGRRSLSRNLLGRLQEIGIIEPQRLSPSKLIEKVWDIQERYLVKLRGIA